MFKPRRTLPLKTHRDTDGVKLYTISAMDQSVDYGDYAERLAIVKQQNKIDFSTPAFAILHDGASLQYLVLAWWRNDNELFISVSVREATGWIEDLRKYSFCLWDMEIIWHERNSFIRHMYSGTPNLDAYRNDLKPT